MPIIIFTFGVFVGSFLNFCVSHTLEDKLNCKSKIKHHYVVSMLSHIFSKGKCRYCGRRISIRYPLLEFSTGIFFLCLYVQYGLNFIFIKYAVLISLLIVGALIDFETQNVYLNIVLFGVCFGIITLIGDYLFGYGIIEYLTGSLIGGGIIVLIIDIFKFIGKGECMGLGDSQICFVCGLFLGIRFTLVMIFLSFFVGTILGSLLILLKINSRCDRVAFVPFILISTSIVMFFGNPIIKLYFKLIFSYVY